MHLARPHVPQAPFLSSAGLEHAARGARESRGLLLRNAICFSAHRPHGARFTVRGAQDEQGERGIALRAWGDIGRIISRPKHT